MYIRSEKLNYSNVLATAIGVNFESLRIAPARSKIDYHS